MNKKSTLTAKNVLRVLTAAAFLLCFCPSFLVSCAGSKLDISLMTVVNGVRFHGRLVSAPAPIMMIGFVIPAIILAMVCIRKFEDHDKACVITTASVVDLSLWFILRALVEDYALSNGFEFKTGICFCINIAVLSTILAISVPISIRKLSFDTPVAELFRAKKEIPLLPQKL